MLKTPPCNSIFRSESKCCSLLSSPLSRQPSTAHRTSVSVLSSLLTAPRLALKLATYFHLKLSYSFRAALWISELHGLYKRPDLLQTVILYGGTFSSTLLELSNRGPLKPFPEPGSMLWVPSASRWAKRRDLVLISARSPAVFPSLVLLRGHRRQWPPPALQAARDETIWQ